MPNEKPQPILSGAQSHECNKKGCFFCYEANRVNIDWYFPEKKQGAEKYNNSWTGCEKITLISMLHKSTSQVQAAIPTRNRIAVQTQLSLYRNKYKAKKQNRTYVGEHLGI